MTANNFRQQIRTAIADEKLQAALDKNAAQRLVARKSAFESFPEDIETLKAKSHAVRAEVISNLDHYLAQFIANVENNEIVVHRAATAAEAQKIVLAIAAEKNAKLISKSKTMMSEEIALNPALEAAGIEVVETDLGEYIVQLRDEHPSHIITPAVHLRKEDVGETFQEKLGIPYTNDIQTLTNVAREKLRQFFLDTDIGISGVNFGVADAGALCIVTNEGNGRMITTLPKTHIALMGIERLVPDFDGLALMLTMLPRSATGQKATVYTQLISKPRQSDELDGADERHLILIDNGRSAVRQTPMAESLYCIRCGACINACPVFREIGGYSYTGKSGEYTPYPGPIGSAISPSLFGQTDFGHLAQASTLCGACKDACPMDIDLPTMLLRVRAGGAEVDRKSQDTYVPEGMSAAVTWGLRGFTWAANRPKMFALAQKLAGAFSQVIAPRSNWLKLPAITGWGYSKDFPKPAGKTFSEMWRQGDFEMGVRGEGMMEVGGTGLDELKETKEVEVPKEVGARFEKELLAVGGVLRACSQDDIGERVLALLREKDVDVILSWGEDYLPDGVVTQLLEAGTSINFGSDPEIRVGLTGAVAGVAETGSILITSGAERPLSTSLLPEIHIAILQEKDIYKNLRQVLDLAEIQRAGTATFISGPSRTADIEMTLTIGVHGPGELYVFMVS
jgi:L-lactate dehydrogenase complex protein LldF